MKQQVSLSEANQHLSRYIEAVERAEEVVIMRHGKPVAKIVRMSSGLRLTGAQELARERMLARMKKGYRLGGCVSECERLHER